MRHSKRRELNILFLLTVDPRDEVFNLKNTLLATQSSGRSSYTTAGTVQTNSNILSPIAQSHNENESDSIDVRFRRKRSPGVKSP